MLIPKQFTLVNRTWKVRVGSRAVLVLGAHEDEDDAHRGLCDPYHATIFRRINAVITRAIGLTIWRKV